MRSDTSTAGTFTAIGGQTRTTYTPVGADQGKYLQVIATATNNAGETATALSAASAQVTSIPSGMSVSLGSPSTVRGALLSATLTPAAFGFPTPITYTYQWQRCKTTGTSCTSYSNISGATLSTYTTAANVNGNLTDIGKYIRVGVLASNAVGTAWVYSARVGPIG
jgi:hypothetical protein